MNAKKNTRPALCMLDQDARYKRLGHDNRLIACEKITQGAPGLTLIVGQARESDRETHPADEGAGVEEMVFAHLGDNHGAIEIIVEPEQWSGPLEELLAALRDRANRRVVVHVGEARIGGDVDQRLVALGYRRVNADDALYLFDIETYKDTPDWLNPRNWANPELWDKYRW